MKTAERRHKLKEALIAAASHSIGARGLTGLKARELAADVRCAAGAIYNVFADLDGVVLAVNARTLAELEARLTAAVDAPPGSGNTSTEQAVAHLIRLAHAYLHFAAAHTKRWRAVFDHRLPDGRELPEDYRDQQQRLFAFIEQPLRVLQPGLAPEQFMLLARSLFSAVHGIVVLGLEEKLGAISRRDLEEQTAAILTALGHGFSLRYRGNQKL
jgi:AcrR family transcriptional regulator